MTKGSQVYNSLLMGRPYPVRHFGTLNDGHIVSSTGRRDIIDHGPSPLPLPIVEQNLKRILGEPWIKLQKKIPGFDQEKLEWVMNDSEMLDEVHGPGTYLRIVAGTEEETLYRALQSANALPSQKP